MARKIIGITGGLATGKTTVADMFVAKGAAKIDADEIAHRLLGENDDIRQRVIGRFGPEILSGKEIDRRKLSKKVFFDKDELNWLCRLLHPEIIRRIKAEVEKVTDKIVIIDAPLLIESGLHEFVDVVVVVTAEHETQIKRATGRGITEKEARNIINNQMPLSEKQKFADHVINNDKNLDITKKGVDKIWKRT